MVLLGVFAPVLAKHGVDLTKCDALGNAKLKLRTSTELVSVQKALDVTLTTSNCRSKLDLVAFIARQPTLAQRFANILGIYAASIERAGLICRRHCGHVLGRRMAHHQESAAN